MCRRDGGLTRANYIFLNEQWIHSDLTWYPPLTYQQFHYYFSSQFFFLMFGFIYIFLKVYNVFYNNSLVFLLYINIIIFLLNDILNVITTLKYEHKYVTNPMIVITFKLYMLFIILKFSIKYFLSYCILL